MMLGSFRQSGPLPLIVFAICLGIFGFAAPIWSADDLAAGAKKEGELNLYLSTDLSDAKA